MDEDWFAGKRAHVICHAVLQTNVWENCALSPMQPLFVSSRNASLSCALPRKSSSWEQCTFWRFRCKNYEPISLLVWFQVYRPNCSSANTHFCPRNHSCIPKADNCISPSLFSCPANSVCMGSGRCLSTCQRQNVSFPSDSIPRTDYVIVAGKVTALCHAWLCNNLFAWHFILV